MKFDAKEKILRLSAEELVLAASARLGHDAHEVFPKPIPHRPADGTWKEATAAFAIPAFSAEVCAGAGVSSSENGTLLLTRRFFAPACDAETKKERERLLRALGFVLCYAFAEGKETAFCFYLEDQSGAVSELCEAPDPASLEKFICRLLTALALDAAHEMERVTERFPTFLSIPFPYADVREGQKDMMSAVYTAAKQGETLFAVAPTGTGKTMATLFPAIRAMGRGHIGKLFYLTPKNTSARAACDAVVLLNKNGMKICALHLVAKERMCAERQAKGECGSCYRRAKASRGLFAALLELIEAKPPVVGEKELAQTAGKHGACPYRLAIAYSKYADLVIGDYNYLFDPYASPAGLFPTDGESFFLVDEAHNLPDRAREMYSGRLDSTFFETALTLFAGDTEKHTLLNRLYRGFSKTVDYLLKEDLCEKEDGKLYGFSRTANFPVAFAELLREGVAALEKQRISPTAESAREKRGVILFLRRFLEKLDAYDGRFLTYAQREENDRLLSFFCIDPSGCLGERLSLGRGAVFFSATLSPVDYYRALIAGDRRSIKIEVPSPFENGALCVGIMDKISVRASAREDTLPEIARIIVTAMKPRRGNYMVFCPSYDYMEAVAKAFHTLTPKTPMAVQKRNMTTAEREAFLQNFAEDGKGYFVGFAVSGGIFSEGVDLVGSRLIGTVVIGVGLPGISAERELISSYYGDLYGEGREYAYLYPGLNRILQAAGRVIRREDDRGIAVLIDDRLRDEACRRVFPLTWRGLKYVGDRSALTALLTRFWQEVDAEER